MVTRGLPRREMSSSQSPCLATENEIESSDGAGCSIQQNEDGGSVDLTTCTPKKKGRALVWVGKLFLVDKSGRPVCTTCSMPVAVGGGNTGSNNTTNLIIHYTGPRADDLHREKYEEAKARHEKHQNGDGSVDLTTCTPKEKGRALVWVEQLFLVDKSGRPVCTTCSMPVAAGSGNTGSNNTTNLIIHYTGPRADDLHREKYGEAKARYEKTSKLPLQPTLSERVFEGLVNWMVLSLQPLSAPEHPALKNVLQMAAGKHKVEYGDRNKFRAALLRKKAEATTTLRNVLNGKRPAVTVGFITMTVHFISVSNSKWVLKSCTCACEVFNESHTGEHIGAKIMAILENLGIAQSVVSITSNTAVNMKKAVEQHTPDSIKWVACIAHKMERSVQAYVSTDGLKQSLDKFMRAAEHLRKSEQSQQTFETTQKIVCREKTPMKIPLGCSTRWWSWWSMLDASIATKASLVAAIESANQHPGGPRITISDDDWNNAAEMRRMLEPFKNAVESLEGDYICAPLIPCVMTVLNAHIEAERAAFTDGSSLGNASKLLLLDDDSRWDEIQDPIKIATAVSARTKELAWLSSREREKWRSLVINVCRKLLKEDIVREKGAAEAASAKTGAAKDDDRVSEPPVKKVCWVLKCIETAKEMGSEVGSDDYESRESDDGKEGDTSAGPTLQERVRSAELELERFVRDKGPGRDTSGQHELAWWCKHQHAYPTIARVAAIYLAVPPTSAASERVFSTAGNVATKKRNRLGSDGADALVFLEGSHGLAWSSGLRKVDVDEEDE